MLVKIKRDLENQIRGLLKNFGLVIGRGKFNVFAVRAAELIENRPELIAAVRPLLEARKAIEQQVDDLDCKVHKLARHDVQVRRFMTVPGVGPITALCFKATIDDPTRFKRSRSVGAYIGLTTRRHASGEIDWSGRISKCGDAMLRMGWRGAQRSEIDSFGDATVLATRSGASSRDYHNHSRSEGRVTGKINVYG